MTDLESKQIEVTIAETIANTAKLNAQTAKIAKETFWYPLTLAIALVVGIGAVFKYLL